MRLAPMAANRHAADYWGKYKAYLSKRIWLNIRVKYSIKSRHTHNMDERGFIAGVISK